MSSHRTALRSLPCPTSGKTINPQAFCGRKIQIANTGGGQDNNGVKKIGVAIVADTCPGCDENHLDPSRGVFQALTGGNLDPPGQFNICW